MSGASLYHYSKSIEGSEPFIETQAEFVEARCDLFTRKRMEFGNPIVVYKYAVNGNPFTSQRVFRSKYFPYGNASKCEEYIASLKSKRKFLVFVDSSNPNLAFIDKSLPWASFELFFLACGLAFAIGSLSFKKSISRS